MSKTLENSEIRNRNEMVIKNGVYFVFQRYKLRFTGVVVTETMLCVNKEQVSLKKLKEVRDLRNKSRMRLEI